MKYLPIIIILAASLFFNDFSYAEEDKFDKAIKAVKAEPKVKSAEWNNKSESLPSLLVGVIDDGTNRNGYAEYICLVLSEHGIKGGVVRIMDEASGQRGQWKELGKASCPKD
jgi:hypothetical protein